MEYRPGHLENRGHTRPVLRRWNNEREGCGGIWFLVSSDLLRRTVRMLMLSGFWSYELSKQALSSPDDTDRQTALKVLLCGGLAGIVTWASIFPLDVVKTRVQTQISHPSSHIDAERRALLPPHTHGKRLGALAIAKEAYQAEGAGVFFRGLGICSVRAFVVNAVQWAVYEWMMRLLQQT